MMNNLSAFVLKEMSEKKTVFELPSLSANFDRCERVACKEQRENERKNNEKDKLIQFLGNNKFGYFNESLPPPLRMIPQFHPAPLVSRARLAPLKKNEITIREEIQNCFRVFIRPSRRKNTMYSETFPEKGSVDPHWYQIIIQYPPGYANNIIPNFYLKIQDEPGKWKRDERKGLFKIKSYDIRRTQRCFKGKRIENQMIQFSKQLTVRRMGNRVIFLCIEDLKRRKKLWESNGIKGLYSRRTKEEESFWQEKKKIVNIVDITEKKKKKKSEEDGNSKKRNLKEGTCVTPEKKKRKTK